MNKEIIVNKTNTYSKLFIDFNKLVYSSSPET